MPNWGEWRDLKMKFVNPIKEKSKIEEIRNYLKKRNKRDWFLFCLGIQTGFRISDLRVLKVCDVRNKTHIEIREGKTGKLRVAYLHKSIRAIIRDYIKDMSEQDYLFKSRQGNKPLGRNQCGNILSQAGKAVGLERISNHTLRKTFGYHHYRQFKDIAVLMDIFNHSSQRVTKRYLGIEQEEIDESMKTFDLLG